MNLKPEEIVRALRCRATPPPEREIDCGTCPFLRDEKIEDTDMQKIFGTDEMRYCGVDDVHIAAAELIERLEKEKAALINTIRGFCRHCKNVDVDENCCRAWVGCSICSKDCPCAGCRKGSKWEWKGVDEE